MALSPGLPLFSTEVRSGPKRERLYLAAFHSSALNSKPWATDAVVAQILQLDFRRQALTSLASERTYVRTPFFSPWDMEGDAKPPGD